MIDLYVAGLAMYDVVFVWAISGLPKKIYLLIVEGNEIYTPFFVMHIIAYSMIALIIINIYVLEM